MDTVVMPTLNERELQAEVIKEARSLGWGTTLSARRAMLEEVAAYHVEAPPLDGLVFHPQYSLGSEPGWPDLVLIRRRDRRLLFVELKSEKGQLSPRQAEILELLEVLVTPFDFPDAGPAEPSIEVYVWRPSDLADGTIVEILT